MRPADLDVLLFLSKVSTACVAGKVFLEPYAERRSLDELGWGVREIAVFLPTLEQTDFVRNEPTRSGPGMIWMFQTLIEGFGAIWIELVLYDSVIVVSFHTSDGEGEP